MSIDMTREQQNALILATIKLAFVAGHAIRTDTAHGPVAQLVAKQAQEAFDILEDAFPHEPLPEMGEHLDMKDRTA